MVCKCKPVKTELKTKLKLRYYKLKNVVGLPSCHKPPCRITYYLSTPITVGRASWKARRVGAYLTSGGKVLQRARMTEMYIIDVYC